MASHLKPIDASGAPDFKNVTPAQSEGISGETERPTKGMTRRLSFKAMS
jgi:hypothetical protein